MPDQSTYDAAVEVAWQQAVAARGGRNAQIYPVLAQADEHRFGISVISRDGRRWRRGDTEVGFAVMSAAKPFTFALLCAAIGVEQALAEVGAEATGAAYNAVEPVLAGDGRTNPMVNAGAIATCARLPGADRDAQWQLLRAGLSAFAGRELHLDEELYDNVMATNVRNRELADALASKGQLPGVPHDALVLYSLQSCLRVTADDLAVMGATIAAGGRNPITAEQVIAAEVCAPVLAVMATAGLYEHSEQWLARVGVPAKSGIGGGMVAIAAGVAAVGTFAPPLDEAGNSVRGSVAIEALAAELGWGRS